MPASRQQRIQQLVEEFQAARVSGGDASADELLDSHPDLLPELRSALEMAEAIASAREAAHQHAHAPTMELGHDRTIAGESLHLVPEQFGKYIIEQPLASGGMGVVLKAMDAELNRPVALKLIRDQDLARTEDVERFQREAHATAQLDHPHIVAIHDFGQAEGRYYIAMQFIEGHTLAGRIQQAPIDQRQAAQWVEEVARAVQFAHERDILHRDLKPSNILIDQTDAPRVTDFGLAKRIDIDSNITASGDVLGTPEYMSPEQALGDVAGATSDVYSLGAVLYESLTGRPPFRAANPAATLLQVVHDEPPSPSELNSEIDRDLETVCLKCLDKEPARRYASAESLADDLQRWLAGVPVTARRPSRTERVWRWCRREPRLAGAIATALALLLFLSVAGPIVAYRQITLRQEADTSAEQAIRESGRRKRAQAETAFQSALVAQRGWQWQQALDALDQALELGLEDAQSEEVSLRRVDALDALDRLDEVRQAIVELEERAEGDSLMRKLAWRKADLARRQGDHAAKKRHAQAALDAGATGTAALFAQSLLADNTPDMITNLQEVYRLDPYQHRARPMLLFLLISSGRLEEAWDEASRLRFAAPDDPRYLLAQACVASLQANDARLAAALSESRARLTEEDANLIEELSDVLANVAQMDLLAIRGGNTEVGTALLDAAAALSRVQHFRLPGEEPAHLTEDTDSQQGGWFSRLNPLQATTSAQNLLPGRDVMSFAQSVPPHVRNSYLAIGKGAVGYLVPPLRRSAIEALAEAADVHPDGIFHFWRAIYLVFEHDYDGALEASVLAADTPSPFPNLESTALSFAILMAANVHLRNQENPELLTNAVMLVHRRRALGPIEHKETAVTAGLLALTAADFPLLEQIIDDVPLDVANSPEMLLLRVQFQLKRGAYVLAHQAAEQIEDQAVAEGFMRQARQQIDEYISHAQLVETEEADSN